MTTKTIAATTPATPYDESCRHCGGEHVAGEPMTYCPMARDEYDRAGRIIDALKDLGL